MAKELSKVKGEKVTIKIKGEEREIKFTFSAWGKLEEEYGGFKNILNIQNEIEEKPFATLPHLLYIGLVDKEGIDEATILDEYGLGDIEYVSGKLLKALYGALPESDEKKAGKEAK